MPFKMRDVGPPLTEARISALERKLRIVLPAAYKSFLLLYNGGKPDPDCFPIRGWDRNPSGSIHYFDGIDKPINSSNIEWNYRILRGRMPRELFPIAGDGSGNLICISLGGANKGSVYIWNHDEEHAPPTYQNVYFIAETFEAFVDSIYHEPISEEEIARILGKPIQRPH